MGSKKQTKQILVRVSELEHKTIKEIAESKRISMNQFIVETILDSIDSKKISDDSELVKFLSDELEEKNNQIEKLHSLLNQQQQLNLLEKKEKEKILIELDETSTDEQNIPFWSRWFN